MEPEKEVPSAFNRLTEQIMWMTNVMIAGSLLRDAIDRANWSAPAWKEDDGAEVAAVVNEAVARFDHLWLDPKYRHLTKGA